MNLNYVQASAGSGKTYTIENDVAERLLSGELLPSQVMAVTFTEKAANELKERISQSLLKAGRTDLATSIMNARIGTVNSVCGQILQDFAFEIGLSPNQRVLDENQAKQVLAEALDSSLTPDDIGVVNRLSNRLSVEDWHQDVSTIINDMRTNGMNAADAESFAQLSFDTLQKHLPEVDPALSEGALRDVLNFTLNAATQLDISTSGFTSAINDCRKIQNQSAITWQNWVKFRKLKPTAKGESVFADLKQMGQRVLHCGGFQQEMESFIHLLFKSAEKTLDCFAELKRERGMVDFVDQELLVLKALALDTVKARISNEIGYLIIDEFQDTNPIQLAIFSKISMLVEKVLMVGDIKQAIYGFRGSDPKLALDVLNFVREEGGTTETLPNSYRSRAGLVHLTNALFTKPFGHILEPEQVRLTPSNTEKLTAPELGWWTLQPEGPSGKEKELEALVEGIRQHISSGVDVLDKHTRTPRKASWRDVAVLFRNNDDAARLAECCAQAGVPVALNRSGLVETPEISLALACLRRLIDASDSLASAEILTLSTGNGPSTWLADRLKSVEENTASKWNDSVVPSLTALAKSRNSLAHLSPSEALNAAMLAGNVVSTVNHWSEGAKLTEHRLANLARLEALAVDYENFCKAQFEAATPTGFILWLKNLEQADADEQAANPGNAVTICTYHKSKGLEWPIVVCANLNAKVKPRLTGTKVTSESDDFDWHNPLAGRQIRYWPNPFPKQQGNDPLTNLLKDSAEWASAETQVKNEAIQLLYVGLTRARDQLILTTSGKDKNVGEWLALINNDGLLPPAADSIEFPCGNQVRVDMQSWTRPDTPEVITQERPRYWLTNNLNLQEGAARIYHQPASKHAESADVKTQVIHDFQRRITINGTAEMDSLGTLIHHCLALLLAKPDVDKAVIERLVNAGHSGVVEADQIISQAYALRDWIATHYPNAKVHNELPISLSLESGSLQQGAIDLALETEDGWIVIDHKSNPQPRDKWDEIAAKHAPQVSAYGDAIHKLTGQKVIKKLIHFTVSGGLVEVS